MVSFAAILDNPAACLLIHINSANKVSPQWPERDAIDFDQSTQDMGCMGLECGNLIGLNQLRPFLAIEGIVSTIAPQGFQLRCQLRRG
jgi:hypothetical protein